MNVGNELLLGGFYAMGSASGVLPICMHCRKIQDSKGGWRRLEQYFREHTGTEFSYGVCPECAKDLFPDLKLYE